MRVPQICPMNDGDCRLEHLRTRNEIQRKNYTLEGNLPLYGLGVNIGAPAADYNDHTTYRDVN